MIDIVAQENTELTGAAKSGSIVENLYVRRTVTVLAVHEHEVDGLSFMNGLSALSLSVASGLVSFAVGIWVNAAFQSAPTPESTILSAVVSPAALVFAAIAAGLAITALRRRGSTLTKIKEQSSAHV